MDIGSLAIYACIAIIALVIGIMILSFIWFFATGLHMTPGSSARNAAPDTRE
jgi:uncharacterized membrane protein (Fun14 family)